jgi:choline dehydrogenase
MTKYDYIVVGGGTAGSVLAARLSEQPDLRVLMLEAGARDPHPSVAVPQDHFLLRRSAFSWGENTVVQTATGTATALPRGRGLGGSSAINAMLYMRGHRSSYDAWVEQGAKGWGFDDLLPYFRRSETAADRNPGLRGQSGPVVVGPADSPNPVLAACLDAAAEAGHRRAEDISGGVEEGFGWSDLNIVAGVRQSASDAYLTPEVLARPNLSVVTNALVRRIEVVAGRAVGVEYSTGGGPFIAEAGREVVLAAGTIGSAKLMMLSGLGPADHLRDIDVELVHDLPGVGSNLQDHPITAMVYEAAREVPAARNNHGEALGLVRTDPSLTGPDLQILFVDVPMLPTGAPRYGFTIRSAVMRPHSRGTVRLADGHFTTAPLLDPNYFGDERDFATMLRGIRMVREIAAAPALAGWRRAEVAPGPDVTDDEQLRAYVGRTLTSYSHPIGTCKIGDDDQSVVDTELRVHGIEGLRIADASVMPSLPSGNTNATVYAIAERAAGLLLGR